MKKYVVDTSVINKLVDGSVGADELPNDGSFAASHIQFDELSRTKNVERRAKLLEKFEKKIDEVLPTESFILGTSRLGKGILGKGTSYQEIKSDLDSRNKGKSNNSEDALIAEIAMKNGYTLLTADYDLYQVAYANGIGVIYWTQSSHSL